MHLILMRYSILFKHISEFKVRLLTLGESGVEAFYDKKKYVILLNQYT